MVQIKFIYSHKGGSMKRVLFILNFIFIIFGLNAKSYRPYPIIFAHGVGVTSKTWGVEPTADRSDSTIEDNLESGHTYKHFLEYMNPYAIAWWEFDDCYSIYYENQTLGEPIRIFFAPDVGPVKFEYATGIEEELIDYEVE